VAVKVSLDVESDLWSETAGGSATPNDVLATKETQKDTVYDCVHWEQYIVPARRHW
jgi:hypothetical protein